MDKHPPLLKSPKIHIWRYLLILVILGLAVQLLVPQIASLESSWSVVQDMTWWAVVLAVAAQIFSYLGAGYMLHAILANNHQKLSIFKGAMITLASASIGLVAGGWVGDAAATYAWVRREVDDNNTATLAGTLPPILNTALLAVMALIGTAYLLAVHDLGQAELIEFGITLLALVLIIFSLASALRYPKLATRLVVWLAGRWAALLHKQYEPEETMAAVGEFVDAWNSLGDGKWRGPLLGAIANLSFDMLTLYFLFIAAGHNVSLGVLFAGYGLPFILARMAFLLPGGLGVVEGSMVVLYDSLLVPNAVSVVVILGYRLLSFWLPSLLGFAAAAYLSRKSFKIMTEPV